MEFYINDPYGLKRITNVINEKEWNKNSYDFYLTNTKEFCMLLHTIFSETISFLTTDIKRFEECEDIYSKVSFEIYLIKLEEDSKTTFNVNLMNDHNDFEKQLICDYYNIHLSKIFKQLNFDKDKQQKYFDYIFYLKLENLIKFSAKLFNEFKSQETKNHFCIELNNSFTAFFTQLGLYNLPKNTDKNILKILFSKVEQFINDEHKLHEILYDNSINFFQNNFEEVKKELKNSLTKQIENDKKIKKKDNEIKKIETEIDNIKKGYVFKLSEYIDKSKLNKEEKEKLKSNFIFDYCNKIYDKGSNYKTLKELTISNNDLFSKVFINIIVNMACNKIVGLDKEFLKSLENSCENIETDINYDLGFK